MDSQNSQSVHTDESNRERNVSKAQILYPELSDEMLETMVIAVEFGIDCSAAERFRFALTHPSASRCLGAEPSDVGVNGCFAIQQWRTTPALIEQSKMIPFVIRQLADWGMEADQIVSFVKKIEVVKA